jgi:hypothetical protein
LPPWSICFPRSAPFFAKSTMGACVSSRGAILGKWAIVRLGFFAPGGTDESVLAGESGGADTVWEAGGARTVGGRIAADIIRCEVIKDWAGSRGVGWMFEGTDGLVRISRVLGKVESGCGGGKARNRSFGLVSSKAAAFRAADNIRCEVIKDCESRGGGWMFEGTDGPVRTFCVLGKEESGCGGGKARSRSFGLVLSKAAASLEANIIRCEVIKDCESRGGGWMFERTDGPVRAFCVLGKEESGCGDGKARSRSFGLVSSKAAAFRAAGIICCGFIQDWMTGSACSWASGDGNIRDWMFEGRNSLRRTKNGALKKDCGDGRRAISFVIGAAGGRVAAIYPRAAAPIVPNTVTAIFFPIVQELLAGAGSREGCQGTVDQRV